MPLLLNIIALTPLHLEFTPGNCIFSYLKDCKMSTAFWQ